MNKYAAGALAGFVLSVLAAPRLFPAKTVPPVGNTKAASEYMDKLAAKYKGLKAYSGSVLVEGRVSGQAPIPPAKVTVRVQEPGLAAMTSKAGAHTTRAVFDGTVLFAASTEHKNLYVRQTLSPGLGVMRILARAGLTGPGLSLLLTQPESLAAIAPPSSLSLGPDGTMDGVAVATVISRNRQGANELTVTYTIGKKDLLLRKMVLVQKVEGGQEVRIVETHSNIKVDSRLPSSAFTFTPPPRARAVKEFPTTPGR